MTANFPSKEQPSTYMVQDRSNQQEMIRLQIQDHMITTGMGGSLPEQPHPISFQRIIDVGCGTGGWLIETARTYPTIPMLVGVDISPKIVQYAQTQAATHQVSDRVEFKVGDALQTLEFRDKYFDLVNQRLGMSYLRTSNWQPLLSEYLRVLQPSGIIRITDCTFPESNSAALTRLRNIFIPSLSQAGHLFTENSPNGVIYELAPLLDRLGLADIQTRQHTIDYRGGTPDGQNFYDDVKSMYRTLIPFFHKWGGPIPNDYDDIYNQALTDMQLPEFTATWILLTAWGKKAP